jgi:hypothetical protein
MQTYCFGEKEDSALINDVPVRFYNMKNDAMDWIWIAMTVLFIRLPLVKEGRFIISYHFMLDIDLSLWNEETPLTRVSLKHNVIGDSAFKNGCYSIFSTAGH